MERVIEEKVHQLYWNADINCARTSLMVLAEIFDIGLSEQTVTSAIGLHGAGGYRAQCGIVEGSLMFLSIYARQKACMNDEGIGNLCCAFAQKFDEKFASLRCYDLRPGGFREDDPPHLCEKLTAQGIFFAYNFIKTAIM